jgi:hypothetical protein
MDLTVIECECMELIHSAQNRGRCKHGNDSSVSTKEGEIREQLGCSTHRAERLKCRQFYYKTAFVTEWQTNGN